MSSPTLEERREKANAGNDMFERMVGKRNMIQVLQYLIFEGIEDIERYKERLERVRHMEDTDRRTELIQTVQRSIEIAKNSLKLYRTKLAQRHRGDGGNAKDTSKGRTPTDEELEQLDNLIENALSHDEFTQKLRIRIL